MVDAYFIGGPLDGQVKLVTGARYVLPWFSKEGLIDFVYTLRCVQINCTPVWIAVCDPESAAIWHAEARSADNIRIPKLTGWKRRAVARFVPTKA